jgi:hypothetical protein
VVSLTCFTLRGTLTIYPFPFPFHSKSLAGSIHMLQQNKRKKSERQLR